MNKLPCETLLNISEGLSNSDYCSFRLVAKRFRKLESKSSVAKRKRPVVIKNRLLATLSSKTIKELKEFGKHTTLVKYGNVNKGNKQDYAKELCKVLYPGLV